VSLERAEQVDLDDRAEPVGAGEPLASIWIRTRSAVERVRVRFLTPTELKSAGVIAPRPEFAILFARLRDRISTLRAFYGAGPLEIDFRAMGERAAASA
jgi:hypothetical protein